MHSLNIRRAISSRTERVISRGDRYDVSLEACECYFPSDFSGKERTIGEVKQAWDFVDRSISRL